MYNSVFLLTCTWRSAALLCVRSLDQVLQSNVQGRLLRSNVSPFRRNETINFDRLIKKLRLTWTISISVL